MPTSNAKSRAFLAKLANTNAARIAAGGVAMVLVLMHADGAAAQTQGGNVSVGGIDGVASVALRADGSAVVTLDSGATVTLPAGSFIQTATGDILVADGTATQIAAAAESSAAAGGAGVAAVAAPIGLLGALAAGGGGGGSSDSGGSGEQQTSSGRVIDGYLVSATVFRDINDSGGFDTGEPNTLTDGDGNWTLAIDPANADATLISFGGIDSSTGKAFTGVLTAPASSTVVTPLTTLVQSYVEAQAAAGTPVDTATAASSLATALGLGGQDLLTLDPIAVIETGGGSASAFQAAAQIASVINAAAAASTGDGATASGAVAASLAQQLIDKEAEAPGTGAASLSDQTVIQSALTAGGVTGDNAAKIGEEVGRANTLIANAGDGGEATPAQIQEQVTKVQEVVQGDLVDSIKADDGSLDNVNVADTVETLVALRPTVTDASATFGQGDLAGGVDVSGTGRPGSTVKVSIDGVDKTTTVTTDGSWTVSFAEADLPDAGGDFAIQARGQAAGTTVFTTPVSGGTLSVDLTAPSLSFTGVPTDDVSLTDQLDGSTITGTTDAGSTVVVTLNNVEKAATVDGAGNFSVTFDGTVNTGETSATLSAVATDANGNASAPVSAIIALQPLSALTPSINVVPASINADDAADGVAISGTGLAGSTVAVTLTPSDDGAPITDTATVGADGTWAYDIAANSAVLAGDGGYTISVQASLADGAISSAVVQGEAVVVDVTAPAAPTDVAASIDDTLSLEERDGTFAVTGKAEPGASVAVTVGAVTKTALVDASGDFTASFDVSNLPLSAASASIEATATDAAGNEGASTQTTLAIEPLSALTPTINSVDQTVGQAGLDDGLTVSGTGRSGSTVTVTLDGVDKTAVVDGSSNWSVDFATAELPDETGNYAVTYAATLSAGATVLESGSLAGGTLVVDLTAADGPIINPIAGDDVLDFKEIETDLVVTGTADAGSTVTVNLGDLTATDAVGADGLFSVTFTAQQIADLPESATVSAFSTDDLDNVSATTTRSFVVTAPIVGTAGVDDLTGTAGNDLFLLRTEGTSGASAGEDEYDFSDPAIEYQEVYYGFLDQAITAEIDMNDGAVSTVEKGTLGTDTLLDTGNTGDFGFGIVTTVEDDTITVQQDTSTYTYSGIYYVGGDDTVNITIGQGATRLQFQEGDAVSVNLADGTAQITNADATVSDMDINISLSNVGNVSGGVEVEGTDGDDLLIGSARNDRFIGRGGDDTIDGGEDRDLVRYDRTPVDGGVFVQLGEVGQALGSWNGENFRHTLQNIEDARGSAGNDVLAASAGGSELRGMAGDDILIGEEGNDVFRGGAGADVFESGGGFDFIVDFTIGEDRLAIGDVIFPEDDDGVFTFMDIGNGAAQMSHSNIQGNVTFGGGITAAQLQAALDNGTLVYAPPATTNAITGTTGDDALSGTAANDLITAVGRNDGSFGYDQIFGSDGDDQFDLSGLGVTDYIEFNYSNYAGKGIVADFSFDGGLFGPGSQGAVVKIGEGIDRISDLDAAGDGVGLIGTAQNDTMFVYYNDTNYHWVGYVHTGGEDVVEIERDVDAAFVNGIFRLSIGNDGSGATVDLNDGFLSSASGSITLQGDVGSASAMSMRPTWEVRTYDGDDDVKGSDSGDRFILGGGDDTVDGRGGVDLVRYDRSEISGGVTVDLGQGTATGIWSGAAFNHTLISIEQIRASAGDDVLIGSAANDELDGRAGDDTMTGGEGSDTFFVSSGHDVILDFDLGNDDLNDRGVDRGEASFEELQFEGVTSVKATFAGDSNTSLTLKGVDLAGFEQWLNEDAYGDATSPAGLNDPMIATFFGSGLFGEDPLAGIDLVSANSTQIVVSKTTDNGELVSTLSGTGLTLDNQGEPTGGQLDTFVVTLGGNVALNLENMKYPLVDFVNELTNDGTIARDVIVKGTPNADSIGFPAQNVWIEAGAGDDELFAVAGTTTGMAPGAGSDSIAIEQQVGSDQTFIFIDPADAGIDMIDGFRITNQSETGDRMFLVGGDDARSHYAVGLDSIADLGTLEDIAAGWSEWFGPDLDVGLFSDTGGNGVLFSIDDSGAEPVLGEQIASFTNIDTSAWDPSLNDAYSNILDFVDQLPEVA